MENLESSLQQGADSAGHSRTPRLPGGAGSVIVPEPFANLVVTSTRPPRSGFGEPATSDTGGGAKSARTSKRIESVTGTVAVRSLNEMVKNSGVSNTVAQAFEKAVKDMDPAILDQVRFLGRTVGLVICYLLHNPRGLLTTSAVALKRFAWEKCYKIYLLSFSSKQKVGVPLHELGHVVYHITNASKWFEHFVSQRQKAIEVYFSAFEKAHKEYFLSAPREMHAQMFSDYAAASRLNFHEQCSDGGPYPSFGNGWFAGIKEMLHNMKLNNLAFPSSIEAFDRERQRVMTYFKGEFVEVREHFEKILDGSVRAQSLK